MLTPHQAIVLARAKMLVKDLVRQHREGDDYAAGVLAGDSEAVERALSNYLIDLAIYAHDERARDVGGVFNDDQLREFVEKAERQVEVEDGELPVPICDACEARAGTVQITNGPLLCKRCVDEALGAVDRFASELS